MSKKSPICPVHKENFKRRIAKNKRGYGLLAIPEKVTPAQWAQKHDPLYKIKGKERHIRSKGELF